MFHAAVQAVRTIIDRTERKVEINGDKDIERGREREEERE